MSTDPTSIDTTRKLTASVLADLATLFDGMSEADPHAATPCADYDVQALTGHVIGWLENFAAGFASADGTCPSPDVTGVVVPLADAADRVRAAANSYDEALATGAAERPLVISDQGGMPGQMAASMILSEYVVHGWDLARATRAAWSPNEQAVTASHALLADMITPEYRGEMFGPEMPVADDAPALDRLVAFTGRDPGWTAPRTTTA